MGEIKQIKDFKIALKDMEPYVKNPNFLLKGREFTNFYLRPREAWANWLLCVVLRKLYGEKCACEIHPKLKLPQNLSSHHLKVLKDLKLLKSRRDGTKIIYSRDERVIKHYQSELTKQII